LSNNVVNAYRYSSAFDPDTISGLSHWYDADDESTISKDGSNNVSAWNDKKGSENLTEDGNKPLWVSGDQNGKDIIDFASSKELITSGSTVSQPQSWYFALTPPANTGTVRRPMLSGSQQVFTASGSANRWDIYAGLQPNFTEDIGTAFMIWQIVFNGSSSYFFVNGVVKMDGVNTGTGSASGLIVSGAYDNWANNKVGEILRYDATISSGDNTLIMNYLQDKWGL